jgi:hypothetical protein
VLSKTQSWCEACALRAQRVSPAQAFLIIVWRTSQQIGPLMRLDRPALQPSHEPAFEGMATKIRHPAQLISVRPGLVGLSTRSCEIRSLTADQAWIAVLTTIGLPMHYYVEIEGIHRRIGCAELHRRPDRVCVRFLSSLSSRDLATIAAASRAAKESGSVLQ